MGTERLWIFLRLWLFADRRHDVRKFCFTFSCELFDLNLHLDFVSFHSEEEISAGRPFATIDTTSIKAPAGQGCPRCGGAVFAAEQMLAKGTMWHKKCFNCAECKRPLDSVLACDGPDKEIHCRGCYAKLFGPKGFGYGHTPVLSTNGESTLNL